MATDETLPEVATEEMAGATNEVGVMTGDGEITTVDSETTEEVVTTVDSEATVVESDSNVARSTITIGPVRSARTPISPSEMSAIDAKHLDRAGAVEAVDEIAPTVVDETTTVDSETTVVDETTTVDSETTVVGETTTADSETTVVGETTTADSETTVVGETTTVDSETTVVGETTEAATGNEVERSPTTIGPVLSVKIPISHLEMSATGVRNPAQEVAAVVAEDEMTVASAPTVINKGTTTVAEAAMVASNVDAPNKAVAVLDPNVASPQMFNLAEPEENARVMHTTNHRAISGHHLGSLSAEMTERT